MTEQECLNKMVAPAGARPSKPYRGGVIQVHVTRACDKACFGCTQGSNLAGKTEFITVENFERAVLSLRVYWGVIGVFGGNPATSPHFAEYCAIMRKHVPGDQRGIWCNNPVTLENAREMRRTFDPSISNLNVHLDQRAHDLFKDGWPECNPVGLHTDSRHSPPFVAMKDVMQRISTPVDDKTAGVCLHANGKTTSDLETLPHDTGSQEYKCRCVKVPDESRIWELISRCDINQHWSAMVGQFRGQLRAWFCEVVGAQAMLHQDEPDYPDTGTKIPETYEHPWWQLPMQSFAAQVRKHCFDCGVPLRGYGELACADETGIEQTSETHAGVYRPKRRGRLVERVTELAQLEVGKLQRTTDYLGNSKR